MTEPAEQQHDSERQPLLPKRSQSEVPTTAVRDADGEDSEVPLVGDESTKRTNVWVIVWYIALLSLLGVGLGFFIKAFIDAGDMDVRNVFCL
jgi:hypothetical protein